MLVQVLKLLMLDSMVMLVSLLSNVMKYLKKYIMQNIVILKCYLYVRSTTHHIDDLFICPFPPVMSII